MELVNKCDCFEIYKTELYKVFNDGKEITLTPIEYKILKCLINSKGEFVPAKDIVKFVWGYSEDETILRVNMGRIKRKIGTNVIVCSKGKGYAII